MDVYDEAPVPLPANLAERIEAEHVAATLAVKLLLATISVVLFDPDVAAHTANHVYAFLTLDEERRAQFVDTAGAVALRLENNGNGFERERAAVARPGLDFFRFEWPLYAYSSGRDRIVDSASRKLTAAAPGGRDPNWLLALAHAKSSEMTLESLRAWLENPGVRREPRARRDLASGPWAPLVRRTRRLPAAELPARKGTPWWIGVARGAVAALGAAMRRGATRAFGGSSR